ncbi:phosphatidylinositol phosphatase PTPRQ-like isoform X2 [Dermacentor albipictus]|uniref:phosphatidylinositol phosphatase PTPRQ-like isoform X2 n=1 Tax=Dermacentor albipictus TaxID=60249 RepID=UPI0038FCC0EE
MDGNALPEVTNMTLLAADDHYITVAWIEPPRSVDFYLLNVTAESGYENDSLRIQRTGTCSNGTFIRAGQSQVTCGPFQACSNLTVTIRTYTTGPPQRTSMGTTLNEVFVSAKDPSEPKRIAMVSQSPYMTRLLWEPPTQIHGLVHGYKVKVCEMYTECGQKQNLSDCVENETSDTWLDFNSTEDTSYCVLITATARCGGEVLTSLPATQEVRTPLFALPDVSNLKAVGVISGHITLSWERPKGRFDYYSVEVTQGKVGSTGSAKHRLNLCANGTIIRQDQTQIACGPLEPCSNLSCTMRTHFTGPPERSSPGVTIMGIFIPAEEPNPPTNITMSPESPSRTRIHWDHPEKWSGIMASYNVKICSTFRSCDRAESLSDCTEYVTSETWTLFDSTQDTLYCVLVTVKTQCGVDEVSSRPLIAEIRTPLFGLPDATDLKLLSALENAVTVAWERPQARFDYYWLSIAGDEGEGRGSAEKERIGSCGNGTIIHPNQTRVTCSNLEACTKVSITLRVHRNGPPAITSPGVSLRGIFIPGEDPDPPKNITMLGKSPSLTRLQWEESAKVYGRFLAYMVKICELFKYCGEEASVHGCIELQAHETWLDFHSNADTKYCVLVTTSSQCGEEVLSGRPAVAEIRTPLYVLPDVTDLRLMAVDSHYITVAWDKPRGSFDYYWLDVAIENDNENNSVPKHQASSCGNGTIIHAEQTEVTCGPFDPCSNISVSVRTFVKGPPERSSMGSTLKGVFLSGQDPSEPKSITIVAKSPSLTRIQWESPTTVHGTLDFYKVKVCKVFSACDRKESTDGCIEHSASEAWLEFQSTADTSYCTHVTASARCGRDLLTSSPATLEVRTPLFALPDVSNLKAVNVSSGYITLSWERPRGRFEYYSIEVTEGKLSNAVNAKHRLGLCANGTIIRRDQTEITCGPFEPCRNLSCTMRTHLIGQPEHSSPGVTLRGIFIPAAEPNPPMNIRMVPLSPWRTRIQWDHTEKVSGIVASYYVKICRTFVSCDRGEGLINCTEYVTSDRWAAFHSTADTPYCVQVAVKTQCGDEKLSSRPLMAEIRTPLNAPPEIIHLRLVRKGENFFTVAWTRPEGSFDYYRVLLKDFKTRNQTVTVGSCANGTIVHEDQTEITCNQLEPQKLYLIELQTHISRPSARSSIAVSRAIVTTPRAEYEVSNLKIVNITATSFAVTWERPKDCIEYYTVDVTDYSSGNIGNRLYGVVSCNNGAAINPRQTSVICTKSDTCTAISVRVKTHTRGPPEHASPGITLENVLIPGTGLPEATNLKLVAVKNDSFTVSLQVPGKCFDRYIYNIRDPSDRSRSVKAEKCFTERTLKLNTFHMTCIGVEACGKVDIKVWIRKDKPHKRDAPAVALRGIYIRGKCHG